MMMILIMIIDDDSDNDTKNRTKLERQESSRLVVRIIKIKMVIIDNDKHNDKGKADDN